MEQPKINIPVELTQLDIDIKAELEKGYEWNEAANRVHDRYKQEQLAKEKEAYEASLIEVKEVIKE